MSEEDYQLFLRTLALYSVDSVARESGVHYTTIYSWLRGDFRPRLVTIAKVLPVIDLKLELVNTRRSPAFGQAA